MSTPVQTTDYSSLVKETSTDFSVHASVYTDPAIFEAEMRNIFERSWCYVGHESEIERPGDFRTSAVGRIPVIVSRGDDGKVHVNINACRHRGTVVCREEHGNVRYFVCPYHGWSYHRDGSLNHITDRDNFAEGWGTDIKGLVPANRTAVYRGMIFASFSDEVPPIEKYLGPLKTYVDYWFDHALNGSDTETVVVPGLVAGQRRCGIPYEDTAASRSEDMVAFDHGALDRRVDRYPAAGSATHIVATHYVANRPFGVREDGDRDGVAHHPVADDVVAVALEDDPILRIVAYPVLPDEVVIRQSQVDA